MTSAPSPAAAAQQLPGLKREQVERAVASLIKHAADARSKAPAQLFDEDEAIYVTIALKKSPHPGGPKKLKPLRIPIPHPLATLEGAEVCLFVKDSKGGEGHKAAKARLAKFASKGGVTKIIGTQKLRTKYESHEAKRQLCGSYDLFLADDRIIPSLPKLIGKSFFKKRKAPIPVDVRAPSFPDQVKRAVEESTFMPPPAGSCVTVRAARAGLGAAAAAENVIAVIAGAAARVPKKWANVQAVYVKTGDSVALPVYQTLPDKPAVIAGAAVAGGGDAEMAEESEGEEEAAAPAAAQQQRGKKAAAGGAGGGGGAGAAAGKGAKQQQQARAKAKPAHGGRQRR